MNSSAMTVSPPRQRPTEAKIEIESQNQHNDLMWYLAKFKQDRESPSQGGYPGANG